VDLWPLGKTDFGEIVGAVACVRHEEQLAGLKLFTASV